MRFRKKPVVIEAFMYGYDIPPKWFNDALKAGTVEEQHRGCDPEKHPYDGVAIKTLEGEMWAGFGCWIIRGVNGELYPCKPDIFEKSYEVAE
ncbi:MAG: hypothetical protein HC883_00330 [Bdellovibrionaceae bacterium]|nr:hypothetical protein [Pseudobdellovibrionaceae bacterium]